VNSPPLKTANKYSKKTLTRETKSVEYAFCPGGELINKKRDKLCGCLVGTLRYKEVKETSKARLN
jgi:hypothetical protein